MKPFGLTPSVEGSDCVMEHKAVVDLESVMHNQELRSLVKTGQMVVSPCGLQTARVTQARELQTSFSVMFRDIAAPIRFVSVPPQLLAYENDVVVAFGKSEDGRHGIFRLTPVAAEFSTKASELIGLQRSDSGTLVFCRDESDPKDKVQVLAPFLHESLRVHQDSCVFGLHDKTLFVVEPFETFEGQRMLYRYLFSTAKGFDEFYPVPVSSLYSVVGFVRWHDLCLMGLRGSQGSFIQSLGSSRFHLRERTMNVTGKLETMWQSPNAEGRLWVSRVHGPEKSWRELCLNRQVIFRGEFEIGEQGIVWSRNGRQAAAHVHVRLDGLEREQIISARFSHTIPLGHQLEEFCVDDHGRLIGWIETDGRFSIPSAFNRIRDRVEYAWNMSVSPDGSIVYNCITADVVMQMKAVQPPNA